MNISKTKPDYGQSDFYVKTLITFFCNPNNQSKSSELKVNVLTQKNRSLGQVDQTKRKKHSIRVKTSCQQKIQSEREAKDNPNRYITARRFIAFPKNW